MLAAGEGTSPDVAAALNELCRTYWYPLYAYLRRQGHGVHDAQDLTQSFLVHLLEKNRLQRLHPSKGKFRSFLLASLKNFLANEWDRQQALKRGAQFAVISLDDATGEDRFACESSHEATPDKAFEKSWALTLLDAVLAKVRQDYAAEGKGPLFDALQVYLSGERGAAPYAETAAKLKLTEGALKMSVLRMRRRFGELLRAEIANTVSDPAEIDEEIRCLFAAVST